MIMSGWILPDMYEVKCLSCSNEHKEIVKRYLSKLKEKDFGRFSEVMHEYFKLRSHKQVIDIEDFVVIKLGWIKVLNTPIKVIFYSTKSPIDFLTLSYKKRGYSIIPIDEKQSLIYIDIPSHELI